MVEEAVVAGLSFVRRQHGAVSLKMNSKKIFM